MTQPLSQSGSVEVIAEISNLNARISSEIALWTQCMADEIAAALWPTFLTASRAEIDRQGYWEDSLMEMLTDYHSVRYRSPGYVDLTAKLTHATAVIGSGTPFLLTRLGNLIAKQFTDTWDREVDWPVEQFSAMHISKHPCESECNKLSCNDILFRSKASSRTRKKKVR